MISCCNIPEDYDHFLCLSRFLTGIPEDMSVRVRALEPDSTHEAVCMAHQFMSSSRSGSGREGFYSGHRRGNGDLPSRPPEA